MTALRACSSRPARNRSSTAWATRRGKASTPLNAFYIMEPMAPRPSADVIWERVRRWAREAQRDRRVVPTLQRGTPNVITDVAENSIGRRSEGGTTNASRVSRADVERIWTELCKHGRAETPKGVLYFTSALMAEALEDLMKHVGDGVLELRRTTRSIRPTAEPSDVDKPQGRSKAPRSTTRLKVGSAYTRDDIYERLGVPETKRGGAWNRGYREWHGDMFIFVTVGVGTTSGFDYPNAIQEDGSMVWTASTPPTRAKGRCGRSSSEASQHTFSSATQAAGHFSIAESLGRSSSSAIDPFACPSASAMLFGPVNRPSRHFGKGLSETSYRHDVNETPKLELSVLPTGEAGA